MSGELTCAHAVILLLMTTKSKRDDALTRVREKFDARRLETRTSENERACERAFDRRSRRETFCAEGQYDAPL